MTSSPTSVEEILSVGLLRKPAFDVVHDLFELRHTHRSFLDGLGESAHQLVAIEGLASAILLHDHEVDLLDPLVGREAPVALEAFPAAADDVAVLALAESTTFSDMVLQYGQRTAALSTLAYQVAKKLLPRLLKKVRIQGAVTHPDGWVPAEARGVLGAYVAVPRERATQ